MNKFEKILENHFCTVDKVIKQYHIFRKSKKIITTEFVKNLFYYADVFYKILVAGDFDNEQAKKDMANALCYLMFSKKRLPLIGYFNDYRLFKYVYNKHRAYIEPYWESKKILLSVI